MISWLALCRLRSALGNGSRDLGALSLFSKPVAAVGLLTPCPDAVCMESSAHLSVPLPVSKPCALSGTDGRAFISPELCQKEQIYSLGIGVCHPVCCRDAGTRVGRLCFWQRLLSHLLRSMGWLPTRSIKGVNFGNDAFPDLTFSFSIE